MEGTLVIKKDSIESQRGIKGNRMIIYKDKDTNFPKAQSIICEFSDTIVKKEELQGCKIHILDKVFAITKDHKEEEIGIVNDFYVE